MIRNMRRRNLDFSMVELWARTRKRGYTRCVKSLRKVLWRKVLTTNEKPKKKYQPSRMNRYTSTTTHPDRRECSAASLHRGLVTAVIPVHFYQRVLSLPSPRRLSGAKHLFLVGFSVQGGCRFRPQSGKVGVCPDRLIAPAHPITVTGTKTCVGRPAQLTCKTGWFTASTRSPAVSVNAVEACRRSS